MAAKWARKWYETCRAVSCVSFCMANKLIRRKNYMIDEQLHLDSNWIFYVDVWRFRRWFWNFNGDETWDSSGHRDSLTLVTTPGNGAWSLSTFVSQPHQSVLLPRMITFIFFSLFHRYSYPIWSCFVLSYCASGAFIVDISQRFEQSANQSTWLYGLDAGSWPQV